MNTKQETGKATQQISQQIRDTIKLLLDDWERIKIDRRTKQEALYSTGPGESPWSALQQEIWEIREHQFSRMLLAAMPDLEPIFKALEQEGGAE